MFFVNPVVRLLVGLWGMEYHRPHHIYCSVPHYRLKDLHAVLLSDPDYREKGMVVHGVLGEGSPGAPSIVDVLGPRYSWNSPEISVQVNTLERADINDKDGIARHSEASRQGRPV